MIIYLFQANLEVFVGYPHATVSIKMLKCLTSRRKSFIYQFCKHLTELVSPLEISYLTFLLILRFTCFYNVFNLLFALKCFVYTIRLIAPFRNYLWHVSCCLYQSLYLLIIDDLLKLIRALFNIWILQTKPTYHLNQWLLFRLRKVLLASHLKLCKVKSTYHSLSVLHEGHLLWPNSCLHRLHLSMVDIVQGAVFSDLYNQLKRFRLVR
jgi:hypothetical protein